MKKSIEFLFLLVLIMFSSSCEKENIKVENTANLEANLEYRDSKQDYFLVANRGSGTISVFDGKSTDYVTDITLPDEGAQPTYLAYSENNEAVYVGDFVNNKVVYYDAESFEYKGEIAIEAGAFHLWINDEVDQLWVNNIVSKTTSVIDLNTNTVVGTIPLPTSEISELTESAVQHDVTISPNGLAAYITVLDGPDKSYVVMYNTNTLEYIRHREVGGDAHLLSVGEELYVPSQNAGEISVLDIVSLDLLDEIPFGSAHGVTNSKKFVFTTGIGDNKVGVIKSKTGELVEEIDTDYNTPHNLAVDNKGKTLFLSHSGGTSTKIVFYKVKGNGMLMKTSEYDSGLNPFGVLYY